MSPYLETVINYAGAIAGRARFDVLDPSKTNLSFEPHTVRIYDARTAASAPTLDREGFELACHTSRMAGRPQMIELNRVQREGDEPLNRAYQQEVAACVKALTGARAVLPQRKGLLVRIGERSAERSWAMPARFAHMDFTASSAELFKQISLADAPGGIAAYERFAVYQTWRAVSPPPQDNLLAVCDGRTVSAADLIAFDAVVGPAEVCGNVFESRICRYRPVHRWYYFSSMRADELLVFKGFDSADPGALNALHTAFDDPTAPADAVPRTSIEARFFAFF
jgi:hypothetical protein